jgi:hypothetical protein
MAEKCLPIRDRCLDDVPFLYSYEEEIMDHQEIAQLLGNYGEFVGAIGVITTLVYLAIQVRQSSVLLANNNTAIEESTKLAKVAAMDRYSESVSRWRGRLVENAEIAELWHKAISDETVQGVEQVRLENLLIDWSNTYRAIYTRASSVGDERLARQAVMSIVPAVQKSRTIQRHWESARTYNEAAQDFVDAVDAELEMAH